MFKEWESDKGGFRVKWVDDVNALIVFADAAVGECGEARRRAAQGFPHHAPGAFSLDGCVF
jgi:hypothetical protein